MATVALDAASTLEDVHDVFQQAVEFDNDHLYDFFVARTPRSRHRVRYDGEGDDGRYVRTVLREARPFSRRRQSTSRVTARTCAV